MGRFTKMKARALLVSVLLSSTAWLAGCGHYVCGATFGNSTCTSSGSTTTGTGNTTAFLYFMDDSVYQVAAEGLNVSNSGNFAPLAGFTTPAFGSNLGADAGVLIVEKQYLYIPFGNGSIYGYSIDGTTGALTTISGTPFTALAGGSAAVADPAGQYLFVGGPSGISVLTINQSTGSLSEIAGSPFTSVGTPTQLVTDGLGKYLYSVVGGSSITGFSYNASGLTALPFTLNSGVMMLASEATGKYLFGITENTGANGGNPDPSIYEFSIAQSGGTAGSLSAVTPVVTTTYPPIYIAVNPNGALVYTFNATTVSNTTTEDPIEGFSFSSSSGALTELSGLSPFTTLLGQEGKFDQSGQYLFEIGEESTSNTSGMIPLTVNTSTGALSSVLSFAGAASYSYGVTDAP